MSLNVGTVGASTTRCLVCRWMKRAPTLTRQLISAPDATVVIPVGASAYARRSGLNPVRSVRVRSAPTAALIDSEASVLRAISCSRWMVGLKGEQARLP